MQQGFHLFRGARVGEEGLVAHAPHHDAGMVPVGANHLLQRAQAAFLKLCLVLLADGVGAGGPVALLLGAACAPEAVLRPEQHALAVALLGEHRVVGVVGAPDEVHAAVLNELHIPGNTGVGDGVGPARVVLVDVGPVDFIGLPVKEEALFGRKGEPPHAEGCLLALGLLALHREGGLHGVELRALGAPQVGGKHLQLLGDGFLFPRGGFPAGLRLGHRFPLVLHHGRKPEGPFLGGEVLHLGLHLHQRPLPGGLGRGHPDALPGHPHRVGDKQAHVPVDAAVEHVLPGPGRLAGIPQVVHPHEHQVLPGAQQLGHIHRKGGVAALVAAGQLAVDVDLRRLESRLELQGHPLAKPGLGQEKGLPVAAVAHIELALHKVGDAKGVGQADVRPGAVVKGRGGCRGKIPVAEFPPLVPQNLFSCHSFFSFYPFS
ncbi:unknown [Firmicutes bacterium CAG:94]|nr:unknown [Firmicutes bacterium CAG:94]